MKLFFYCLFFICVLSSCDAIGPQSEDTDLLIGVALPQTGTLGNAGQSVTRGIHLALRDHGDLTDVRLSLVIEDTRSTPSGAKAAFEKLAQIDNLPAVFGPLSSTATEAALSVIQENNLTALGPTSSKSGLSAESDYLFRSSITVERIVPAGIRTAKENLKFQNVATLYNAKDAFSVSSHEKITEELQKLGSVTISIEESFSRQTGNPLNDADFTVQLDNILSAQPPVDAIFLSGLPEDHVKILVAAHRKNNEHPFVVTLLSIAEVHTINELEPGAAEDAVSLNIWLASSADPLSRAFVKSYTDNFGMPPDDWAARGYTGASLMLEALRRATTYDSAAIQESLSGIKAFPTIFGSFSFDDSGDAIFDPVIATVKDNDFLTWPVTGKR